MFQSVRNWWGGGRGKVTARLFAFEFLVVVAGVLAAQGLANWVAERGERAEGQRLLSNATIYLVELQTDLNYWARFGPCLRRHVERISSTAASGGSMTAEEIGRPGLPLAGELQFSADDWRKIREIIPEERVDALDSLIGTGETYKAFIREIARHWALLRLLDPQFGPASAIDRSQVRMAAMVIDNNIRWMMFQHARGSTDNYRGAGIPKDDRLPDAARLVDRCGLLKDWR